MNKFYFLLEFIDINILKQSVIGDIVGSDIPVNRAVHFNMGTQNNIS
ncbi:hypothetical protein K4Q92_10600 [Staphylococcus epidermidis]|nr:hypothetical protein [Staphylococcus epidermidis]MBM5957467.1 hypothetical protein [Staphylococcus epidermidis]MBM5979462.1 hypothetical protein [Staphylococcus epidermidis]MCG1532991.1 hypothetical protein [Staphylococcus epidermidis]MCG1802784.1 hypothetical protein [Staphylococcus epidermidis]MCW7858988.1 hypothetical protein [Staphylococcus epidermidis]